MHYTNKFFRSWELNTCKLRHSSLQFNFFFPHYMSMAITKWPKNVTCLIFQLSNQLLSVNKVAEFLVSIYPISHVNHHSWHFLFIPKCENDHFRFKLWNFLRFSWSKLCNFHFDVQTKCLDFQWFIIADWNFWSILTSCLLVAANLRAEKINKHVLFSSVT